MRRAVTTRSAITDNNIEIKGVSLTEGEGSTVFGEAIGSRISVVIADADIDACHGVPFASSTTAKTVIALSI